MYVSNNIGHTQHKWFPNMYGMCGFMLMFGFMLWLLAWIHLKPRWHIAGGGHRGLQRSHCCISSTETVWAMSGWLSDVEALNACVYFRTVYGVGTTSQGAQQLRWWGRFSLFVWSYLGCDFGVLFGIRASSGTTFCSYFYIDLIVHLEILWVSLV